MIKYKYLVDVFKILQVLLPPGSLEYHGGTVGDERVLDDSECPLAIVMQHSKNRGVYALFVCMC